MALSRTRPRRCAPGAPVKAECLAETSRTRSSGASGRMTERERRALPQAQPERQVACGARAGPRRCRVTSPSGSRPSAGLHDRVTVLTPQEDATRRRSIRSWTSPARAGRRPSAPGGARRRTGLAGLPPAPPAGSGRRTAEAVPPPGSPGPWSPGPWSADPPCRRRRPPRTTGPSMAVGGPVDDRPCQRHGARPALDEVRRLPQGVGLGGGDDDEGLPRPGASRNLLCAQFRNPPNSVSMAPTNACRSLDLPWAPRTLALSPVIMPNSCRQSPPGPRARASSRRMNRPSRKPESRSGASRKSSADPARGVSTTIRSYVPSGSVPRA